MLHNENNDIAANDVWFDKQDMQLQFHVSSRTLFNWRKKGILAYVKLGGKIYYRLKDIEDKIVHNPGHN